MSFIQKPGQLILTPQEAEIHFRLENDHEFFARHIQQIDPKDLNEISPDVQAKFDALIGEDSIAGLVPLIFHPGQHNLHMRIEEMKKRVGYVRLVIVKPRQVGWSTILLARAHWLATKQKGLKIQILSHTSDSTRKFLRRLKKMCLACPSTIMPGKMVDNAKEIMWQNGACATLATAGTPDAIRSDSFHYGLASEEPMYEDGPSVMASFLPALSNGPGSEGYREGTSKGKGTPWHQLVQQCQAGEGRWELFFDPWFNHPKYAITPPPDWRPDDEEEQVRKLYRGTTLTDAQLYWRHLQIIDLRAKWLFKQEFPGTVEESFQAAEDTLLNPDAVERALRNFGQEADNYAPLICGIDVARGEHTERKSDRTVLFFRQGNVNPFVDIYNKMDDMRLAGILANYLQNGLFGKPISMMFIDYTIGEGIRSRLNELGFGSKVHCVNPGESPFNPKYLNKRAEMAIEGLQKWLGDTGEHVALYNPPEQGGKMGNDISSDLLAVPGFKIQDSSAKIKLEAKDVIKKLYGKSTDIFDAATYTFAEPVYGERPAELQKLAKNHMSHLKPNKVMRVMDDFDRE